MAKVRKEAGTQRWISFDGKQENLGEVVAVVSTIKGARIEEKAGVTRIYIPKQTPPSASFRTAKVFPPKKLAVVKTLKETSPKQHYCAIMLK